MRSVPAILIAVLVAMLATPAVSQHSGTGAPLAIIVHPSRAVDLNADDIARIYLKKRRLWDDGQPIVPINQEAGSLARESFSRQLFGSDSSRLGAYWNEQYFHGIFPPITLSSNAAVKRYVASDPNAIGYIELNQTDDSVRVALRLE